MSAELITRLVSVTYLSELTVSLELRALDGSDLPSFTAGAHVNIRVNEHISRSYSLINDQNERHRYVIAVQLESLGRGGSSFLHKQARVGMSFSISPPKNDFKLEESAPFSMFFAGGIGITPIRSMILRLESLRKPWKLLYAVRSRNQAVFLPDLIAFGDHVDLHASAERDGRADIAAIIAAQPAGTHFYCCGPKPMLHAFGEATALQPASQVHSEQFSANEAASVDGGFFLNLARTGRTIQVLPGETVLDALLKAGLSVPYSCQQGVCGTCETKVLGGTPDHRDSVLSDAERASNKSIIICCSGALSDHLVLDL